MIPFQYTYRSVASRAYIIEHFPGPEYDRYLVKSDTELIIIATNGNLKENVRWFETPESGDRMHDEMLIEAMGKAVSIWMNLESF